MNLVSLIMQFLGPAIVSKLASSLGINQTVAQRVIAAAVPAILAALAGRAAQPGGAGSLFDAISKQDPGMLGKLASVIGGGAQTEIAKQGNSMLGSLLGPAAVGTLTGALGKFAGVGEAPTQGLLGMLAPVVLGTLGQQQKSAGLDAGGLAKLLASQKGNIAAALPGDFAKMLSGTGLLDSLGAAKPAAASAAPAKPAPAPAPMAPVRPAAPASTFNWWPWLIVIALAAAAWWAIFAGAKPRIVTQAAAPQIMANGTNIGSQLEGSLKGLQDVLGGIKDVPSAQAAVPKLRDAQASLDKIGGVKDLTPDSRRAIAGYVASWLPTLTPMITNLLANTAVAPIVKPVLDGLRSRLEAMAKA